MRTAFFGIAAAMLTASPVFATDFRYLGTVKTRLISVNFTLTSACTESRPRAWWSLLLPRW